MCYLVSEGSVDGDLQTVRDHLTVSTDVPDHNAGGGRKFLSEGLVEEQVERVVQHRSGLNNALGDYDRSLVQYLQRNMK
jgi:hypothetical protein